MLGHTNIRTTQHYAKILDIKVGADMALLKSKLANYNIPIISSLSTQAISYWRFNQLVRDVRNIGIMLLKV